MTTVPLILERDPDDPECANLMVDGTVGGLPRRFILDTGAPRTALIASDDLDLEPRGVDRESGGVFGPADQQLASVRDLRVGPVTVDELTVSVSPPGEVGHNWLGMDVLGEHSWRISLSDLTLTREASLTDSSASDLYMDPRGHPCLDLVWDDATAGACWDTGAGITVVDASFAARNPQLFSEETVSSGTDSTGATRETPTFLMRGPTIATHQFRSRKVAVVDLSAINAMSERPTDLILGFTTLSQADWLMDFPSRRWSATMPPSG